MNEQGFNHNVVVVKEIPSFFESRMKKLELKKYKKRSFTHTKDKVIKVKSIKRRLEDSDSSIIELSSESFVEYKPKAKKCNCNHNMDNCYDLKIRQTRLNEISLVRRRKIFCKV